MPISETKNLFADLEKSLRSLISEDATSDYNRLSGYLACAQEINAISKRFQQLTGQEAEVIHRCQHTTNHVNDIEAEERSLDTPLELSPGSPIYFIYKNNLYKIGMSSSGADRMYRKVIPADDAKSICGGIVGQLKTHSHIDSTQLQSDLPFPGYKIQMTIMALVSAGAIRQVGRGKYAPLDELRFAPTTEKLMSIIASLPVRVNLLEKCNEQHG